MYCKNCGKEVNDGAVVCITCGSSVGTGNKYCQNCGNTVNENAEVCMSCGFSLKVNDKKGEKSKMAGGLLGIFLGAFGVHNFYLGYTTKGIIQLVLTLAGFVTCGITTIAAEVWGLVDGIMIITGKIDRDGNGQLLKD